MCVNNHAVNTCFYKEGTLNNKNITLDPKFHTNINACFSSILTKYTITENVL